MCSPAAIMGMQAAGAVQQASAANTAGQTQNAYYQYLATQNLTQANAVTTTANVNTGLVSSAAARQETNLDRNVATVSGQQKAGLAANGVWGGSGTAADVARDTQNKADLDRAAIRQNANLQTQAIATNATNQTMALKTQAGQFQDAGNNAAKAGRLNAESSLLTGATQVASNWYKFNQVNGNKPQPSSNYWDNV